MSLLHELLLDWVFPPTVKFLQDNPQAFRFQDSIDYQPLSPMISVSPLSFLSFPLSSPVLFLFSLSLCIWLDSSTTDCSQAPCNKLMIFSKRGGPKIEDMIDRWSNKERYLSALVIKPRENQIPASPVLPTIYTGNPPPPRSSTFEQQVSHVPCANLWTRIYLRARIHSMSD